MTLLLVDSQCSLIQLSDYKINILLRELVEIELIGLYHRSARRRYITGSAQAAQRLPEKQDTSFYYSDPLDETLELTIDLAGMPSHN